MKRWQLWAWLFALCFLLRLPSFWLPLINTDESQFAVYADVLLRGGIPYLHSVDTKPLGIYTFFEICFWLFGKNNMIAVHIVSALCVLVTAGCCWKIAEKLIPARWAYGAALFYIVATTTYTPKYLSTSIALIMMLPLSASLLCLLQWEEKEKSRWLFLSGLLLGLGCLFKYQGGVQLVVGICYLLFFSPKGKIRHALWYGLGWIVVGVLYLLYLRHLGVLREFYFWSLKGSVQYLSDSGKALHFFKQLTIRGGSFVLCNWIVWRLAGRQAFAHFKKNQDPRWTLMLLWLVFSFVAVSAGSRFYDHYFIQLVPALAILAAGALPSVQNIRRQVVPWLVLPAILCFAARVAIDPINRWTGEENLSAYRPIGQYIAQHTTPEETLFVWGLATPIYFFADRNPASRFLWSDWQSGRVGGNVTIDPAMDLTPTQMPGAWEMLFEDLEKNRPVYFLDTTPGDYHEYKNYPVSRYPQMVAYLKAHYFLETTQWGVDFYKRR